MSVIAEFTIDSSEFVLGTVLARDPETHVEMERVVPASGRVMPYVWVEADDLEGFETAIRESEYVRSLTALDVVGRKALYRIAWDDRIESLVYGMAETNATILEARGNREWLFRIRFDDHAGLTDFHNYCTDHEIDFRLSRVYTLSDEQRNGHLFDLTPAQRNALVEAVEAGYFEIPRRATLSELGAALDISEQSVSENVRRGVNTVLKKTLFEPSAADLQH